MTVQVEMGDAPTYIMGWHNIIDHKLILEGLSITLAQAIKRAKEDKVKIPKHLKDIEAKYKDDKYF